MAGQPAEDGRTTRPTLFNPKSKIKNPKSFTLIELLVVVAIIAVLVALLLPAIQRARSTAQKIACGSNLRQVGLIVNAYLSDFNGFMPDSMNSGWTLWHSPHHPLAPYFQIPVNLRNMPSGDLFKAETQKWEMTSLLKCPSEPDPPTVSWEESALPDYTANGWCLPDWSFWHDWGQGWMKRSWSIEAFTHPASYVAFGERNNPDSTWSHHDGNAVRNEAVWPNYITFRHTGEMNILFTDWHVAGDNEENVRWAKTDLYYYRNDHMRFKGFVE